MHVLRLSPKLLRNVPLHDRLLLFPQYPLCLVLHHVMFPKVLNILRVDQVFLSRVLVVVFLKVMNLVLVLIVAVVAWPHPEVGEFLAFLQLGHPLVTSDEAGIIGVEDLEHVEYGFVLFVCGSILQGFVVEAICAADFASGPGAVIVEVVE